MTRGYQWVIQALDNTLKVKENVKVTRMCVQRLCKNVSSPDGPLFAASCCLSLLRASIFCKPALCLGRDFFDLVVSCWDCGLDGAGVGE